jgi:hypothetical protein
VTTTTKKTPKPPTDWFYVCRCGHSFKKPLISTEIIEYLLEFHPGSTGLCPECYNPVTLHTVSLPPPSNIKKRTIEERFAEFHEENPHIYPIILQIILELLSDGRPQVSVKHVYEVVRAMHGTYSLRDINDNPFKLCNDFTSRYARVIREDYPELKKHIVVRRLKVP